MQTLTSQELDLIHAYWRAANYLSVGQIYLLDNPLLRQPLELKHVKPRLLGHWGTTPGLNFIMTARKTLRSKPPPHNHQAEYENSDRDGARDKP